MSFGPKCVRFGGVIAAGLSVLIAASPALAGICFTSGKVYVQQKVYDKASWQLECARKEEPDNAQAYALLGFARGELRQYASAGAIYQLGIQVAEKKKDQKRVDEMVNNRKAKYIDLFNSGVKALQRAGKVTQDDSRTTDEGSPQAAMMKERGEPKDFARFTENGKPHEFWYYPEQKAVYHFAPGSEPLQVDYRPFVGAQDPAAAATDTTVYPPYTGASALAEAAYNFELAMLIDPTSPDIYKNLSYVYEVLGRTDDAIRAAQKGLALKPGDKDLTQNLRVAAMGRGNRLFKSEKFSESIPAYRAAMSYDEAGKVQYLSLIADAFQNLARKEEKGPKQAAYYDSAGVAYMAVYESAPADSLGTAMKENALYNAAIIQVNLENYKGAADILTKGTQTFPNSKDLWLLQGQNQFQLENYEGAVTSMKKVVELNPKEADAHQILFHAYNKQNKKAESVSEYTIYKALSEGKPRTGSQLKTWVDSAGNRLPKGHQLDKTKAAEGYPEEVRTYMDGDRTLESWFYWTKGKSITFLEGQVFSQATFPPAKM